MSIFEDGENGVPPEAYRRGQDLYIIYSFEDVAFHWAHGTGKVLRKFKNTSHQSVVENSNRLYMDARMGGRLASREEYEQY